MKYFFWIGLICKIPLVANTNLPFSEGKKYEVVKSTNGEYILVQKTLGTIQVIENSDTLEEFYIRSPYEVPILDPVQLSFLRNDTKLPFINLKKDKNNPDDLIGTIIKKSINLQPPIYWKESYFLLGYFNPAFVVWNNETLVAWRR